MKKQMKQFLCMLLCLVMLLTIAPIGSYAATENYTIVLSEGKVYKVKNFDYGNNDYGSATTVSGITGQQGEWGEPSTYTFNNLKFTTSATTGLYISDAYGTVIYLNGTNIITSGATSAGNAYTYGIRIANGDSGDHIIVKGTGSLTVTAGDSTGYGGGSVGIYVGRSTDNNPPRLELTEGATVTANAGDASVSSMGINGSVRVVKGTVNANGGDVTSGNSNGIWGGIVSVDSNCTVNAKGGTAANNTSCGIQAWQGIYAYEGSKLTATGGSATNSYGIDSNGYYLYFCGDVTIVGGSATGSSYGVIENNSMTVVGGTTILKGNTAAAEIAPRTQNKGSNVMKVTAGTDVNGIGAAELSAWVGDKSDAVGNYRYMKFEPKPPHVHIYDREVATEEHRATPANCIVLGSYYKSCECGANGTELFAGDTFDPDNHISDKYVYDSNEDGTHKKLRKCCYAQVGAAEACSYGTDHICDLCGYERKAHEYETFAPLYASFTEDGILITQCKYCYEQKSRETIAKVSTPKLSDTQYTYDGKVKKPTVTVKDSKGNRLKEGTDYTVKYESGRKAVGEYNVKITLKGNYSGTKTLKFKIVPKVTSKITLSQSTSAIKATWKKVDGADGYKVYLYKGSKLVASKTVSAKTLSYRFSGLASGTKYTVKVKTYQKADGENFWSSAKAIGSATKPATPKITSIKAGSKSATLKWSNISGESGYQVYYATSKDGKYTKGVQVKADDVSEVIKDLTKGKTYYFKVRAYKKTDSGTVFSAWSAVKSVKVK